jgi:CO/xanthine dehydrogenase FAD-binding subunit
VELAGKTGFRKMPISRFITGPGATGLNPEEILYRIWIPKQSSYDLHHFEKVGHRKSLSIAILSMAALIGLTRDKKIRAVRLAWGSLGKTIVTSPETEKRLMGTPMDDPAGFILAAARIREEVSPISDVRAGADYRRQVAGNLVLRLCQGPLEPLKQGPGTL